MWKPAGSHRGNLSSLLACSIPFWNKDPLQLLLSCSVQYNSHSDRLRSYSFEGIRLPSWRAPSSAVPFCYYNFALLGVHSGYTTSPYLFLVHISFPISFTSVLHLISVLKETWIYRIRAQGCNMNHVNFISVYLPQPLKSYIFTFLQIWNRRHLMNLNFLHNVCNL